MTPFELLLEALEHRVEGVMQGEVYAVPMEDGTVLELADEGENVLGLYSEVGLFAGEPTRLLLEEIAVANYGCAGTDGATLGLDPERHEILLTRYWPLTEDAEAAVAIVGAFAETAQRWRKRFEEAEEAEEAGAGPEETEAEPGGGALPGREPFSFRI